MYDHIAAAAFGAVAAVWLIAATLIYVLKSDTNGSNEHEEH